MFGRQRQPAEVRPLERGSDQSIVRFRPVPSIALCLSAWMLLSAASLRSDEPFGESSTHTAADRTSEAGSSSTLVSRSSAARRSNVWRARPAAPERPLLNRSSIENPAPEPQARRSSRASAAATAGTQKKSVVQTAGWRGTSSSAEVKGTYSQATNLKGTQVVYRPSQPPNELNLDQPRLPIEERDFSEPPEPQTLPPAEEERALPVVEQDVVPQEIIEERNPDRNNPRATPRVVQDRPAELNSPENMEQDEPRQQMRADDLGPQSNGLPEVTTDDKGVINIPFRDADTVVSRRDLELRMNNGLITLIAKDASLSDILSILAHDHGLNIVSSDAITQQVSVTLRDVPLADALNAILSIQGLSWSRRNNILSITKMSTDQAGGAIVQGRVIKVFPLSYVSGTEVEAVIKDLLSPVGKVKSMQSEKLDTRKSSDRLIVEDLPDYLDRIEACIHQLDRPPKQVQIEAHILEVDLSAENRHGVNLEMMSDIAGTKVSLKTPGFAKTTSNPALLVGIDGSKVDGLLDALKNTVDARTLASPQVLVTHGQEAKIQIGGKIGYRQSTTTETSTVQGVEFLDVGVVLIVTPYIGANGQVLMKVNPEVSDGSINLDTELPDEQITTVDSTVLLNDGQGMVIGGLIREIDDDQRIKAAGLGELWMIGHLFQQSRKMRSRKEVIVVLIPQIVDCPCPLDAEQQTQLDRTETPLFHGALEREFRPWEPELPEVRYRPRDTRRNIQEFRKSEGTRWIPEPPRSADYYLNEPPAEVPVIMEPVPPEEGLIMEPPPEIPPIEAGQGRPRADRIPVEAGQQSRSVQRVSGSRQAEAGALPGNISQKSRQNRPVPENQAFHGQVKKSESSKSGQQIKQKISAQNGSSSKGFIR
jgi:type IV pilus assembly protein PilQ